MSTPNRLADTLRDDVLDVLATAYAAVTDAYASLARTLGATATHALAIDLRADADAILCGTAHKNSIRVFADGIDAAADDLTAAVAKKGGQ